MSLIDNIPDLKDQLNLLAEAFHKYEIAEVRSGNTDVILNIVLTTEI